MKRDKLLQIFNGQISGKNHVSGIRVLNNDLVASINIDNIDNVVHINGNVISESLFNEYKTEIEIDVLTMEVISTYCSCKDYENNEFKRNNYCCKHLIASFYKALKKIDSDSIFIEDKFDGKLKFGKYGDVLSKLIDNDEGKEEIKIEVYVKRNQWENRISVQFKIGTSSMGSGDLYVLKDINHFLIALSDNIQITYGKNFTFDTAHNKLSVKDKLLVDFINTIKNIDIGQYHSKIRKSNIEGKYLHIPDYMVREFFQVVKNHKVYLEEGFLYRCLETQILQCDPPIDFELKISEGNYVLQMENGIPIPLGSRNNVFFYGADIYLPDLEYCQRIKPYFDVFSGSGSVFIPASREETVLRKLLPQLELLSENVKLDYSIKNKIVREKCNFNFYFDERRKKISLILKVKYGAFQFNIFEDCREKIVYRDLKKEAEVLALLSSLGFEHVGNQFYIAGGDDYIFRFFKNEIKQLQSVGQVFYSENFKGIKSINTKNINASIKSGKYNYFEMEFKFEGISSDETNSILEAFQQNLKYYKLKNGEYLDLEELELKKFLKLLDVVSYHGLENNCVKIPKSKSIYIDKYIGENNIRYIKGKSQLADIRKRLENINTFSFKQPDNLRCTLRDYQKTGYNWFKTLDYLGFGGILGDEMGLGKTFQAIAFLLSNMGKKSLIVVPTSLTYNWIHEFKKIAPDMKVAAISGPKRQRKELLENISKYDVFITTYNLLKMDMEIYTTMEFDYCFLDEAQYIKNPHSKNAQSVKKVKSGNRFALSGTPIENSVMELWSIFDFIMPGYLYSEKRFNARYYKRFKEEPVVLQDLNRLIKPFILRRRKKDVIRELPDKIEKTIMVDMGSKQKKIYYTYAKHIMKIIDKKLRKDEFKNSRIEILAYITKLRQICLDPSIVMDDYNGQSAKIEALMELLIQSTGEGHKILVFSQFTSVLENIEKVIESQGINCSYLDGSIPSKDRMEIVDKFNSGKNPVFLISLKAGGTGLNLTSADLVVHFDPWWNPAVEDQATDRAHRIGQKHVVEVIKLVVKGTIEEKIIKLQQEKRKLAETLIGNEFSGSQGIASLSEEEVVKLFK